MLAAQEHRRHPPLPGLHHPLQHLLQRRHPLQGNAQEHGDQLRGRLLAAAVHASRRGPLESVGATAPGRLHPLHREGSEGNPAPFHTQAPRQERRHTHRRSESLVQARRIQSVPAQRLAAHGQGTVLQRRLRRSRLDFLLHQPPLLVAPQDRHRGAAMAGAVVYLHGLALRSRSDTQPHQTRRAHRQFAQGPLQLRRGRLPHQEQSARSGRAIS